MALFLFPVALAIEYVSIHVYLYGLFISEATSSQLQNQQLFKDYSEKTFYQQPYIQAKNESVVSG